MNSDHKIERRMNQRDSSRQVNAHSLDLGLDYNRDYNSLEWVEKHNSVIAAKFNSSQLFV